MKGSISIKQLTSQYRLAIRSLRLLQIYFSRLVRIPIQTNHTNGYANAKLMHFEAVKLNWFQA